LHRDEKTQVKRVLLYCRHTIGIGHLVRSLSIGEALAQRFDVLMALGGERVEGLALPVGIRYFELPAVAGLTERLALGEELGNPLLAAAKMWRPDVILTELYPFGRKSFDAELLPMLRWAKTQPDKPLVVSSVRDILVHRANAESFEQRVVDIIGSYFDLVLVHGDERFAPLELTFSRVRDLACPVRYTGYVTRAKSCTAPAAVEPRVVVSNGGGRCAPGQQLLRASVAAALRYPDRLPYTFEVYTGPLAPDAVYSELCELANGAPNIHVARFTPDLGARLRGATLAISMGGYNTVLDLLGAMIPALIYPEYGNGDTEQEVRAERLEKLGAATVLSGEDLQPERLMEAIERIVHRKPAAIDINLDGASNTARILEQMQAQRSIPAPVAAECLE
jgi:predicted glycosyltransferase